MDKITLTEQDVKTQIKLLDKVKKLFLLPKYDCLTLTQAADYFEVSPDCIKRLYQRRKEEFDEDGVCVRYPADFKIFNGTDSTIKNMRQEHGKLVFNVGENTQIIIPNRGITCFSRSAVVRIGMMLTGSRVSKEVRNQLLNIFAPLPDEQKTAFIDRERMLIDSLSKAAYDGNTDEVERIFNELKDIKNGRNHIGKNTV